MTLSELTRKARQLSETRTDPKAAEKCRKQTAALLRAMAEWNGGRPKLQIIQGGKT